MVGFDIKVDDRNLRRLMRRLDLAAEEAGRRSVEEIAEYTKNVARFNAPAKTGLVRKGIVVADKVKRKGYYLARIGFLNNARDVHPEKEWNGTHFNLPLWMTYSQRALRHPWRNGKTPRFLNVAAEYGGRQFFRLVESSLKRNFNNA